MLDFSILPDQPKKKDILDFSILPDQPLDFSRLPDQPSQMQQAPWKARHPNLYAIGMTASEMVPHLSSLIDPEERSKFNQYMMPQLEAPLLGGLGTPKELPNPQLLGEDLFLMSYLFGGPVIKGTGRVAAKAAKWATDKTILKMPYLQKWLPKTYARVHEFMTKPRMVPRSIAESPKVELVQKPAYPVITPKPTHKMPLPKTEALRIEETKKLIDAAIAQAQIDPTTFMTWDSSKRTFRLIAEALEAGEIPGASLQSITQRYGTNPSELAAELLHAASYWGKGLNQLSQFAKKILKAFPKDAETQRLLGKFAKKSREPWAWLIDKYKWGDNKLRAAMVSQMATAARNAESQGIRGALSIFDHALQGAIRTTGITGGKLSPKQAFIDVHQDFLALAKLFPDWKKLSKLLDEYPFDKAKLLSAPIHDIVLGDKISRMIMVLNRGQEILFRRWHFAARVQSQMAKKGLDAYKDKIPRDILDSSVKEALELTWAAMPETRPGKMLMHAYKEFPMLTLAQPFPRFYLNALRFLWEFNPTGLADMGWHLFNKNPAMAAQSLSRAAIGTMMLGGALYLRNSDKAGPRYYHLKVGTDKEGNSVFWDTRAFAPFSSYLYLAEEILSVMGKTDRSVKPTDRLQALVGINRIAGTGLVLVDLIRAKRPKTALRWIAEVFGQRLGAATVPGRTIQDFLSTIDKEEQIVRHTREHPFYQPLVGNIPYAARNLHPAPRLTRAEPYKREWPKLRQLTGITVQTMNQLEEEIARLGIEGLWPRTGDVGLDRKVTKEMGPLVERMITPLVQSRGYQLMDDQTKAFTLKTRIGEARNVARDAVFLPHIESKLQGKTKSAKKKYITELIETGKFSQSNFNLFHITNVDLFTPKEWEELFRLKNKRIGVIEAQYKWMKELGYY